MGVQLTICDYWSDQNEVEIKANILHTWKLNTIYISHIYVYITEISVRAYNEVMILMKGERFTAGR